MTSVVFSLRASRDLVEIGRFAARDSPKAALRLMDRLEASAFAIGRQPMRFRSRDEISPGLRAAVTGRYTIFFRVLDDRVRIVRILHGARNFDRIVFD